MANILVIGSGAMGSAIGVPAVDANNQFTVFGTPTGKATIQTMQAEGTHPGLQIKLPKNINWHYFEELKTEHWQQADLLVLGVSSAGFDWATKLLQKFIPPNLPVLIVAKGLAIQPGQWHTLAGLYTAALAKKHPQVIVVGGPCLAKELAHKHSTKVVFASASLKLAQECARLFETDYYQIETTDDIIGVEVCAAIKNVYAIAVGAAKYWPTSSNQRNATPAFGPASIVFQQAIAEMRQLVEQCGGQSSTVLGLAGIGDLFVTSLGGRNVQFGNYLGQGHSYAKITEQLMPGITVEGALLASRLATTNDTTFPWQNYRLLKAVVNSIHHNQPFNQSAVLH